MAGEKILVIDDEEEIRELISIYLINEGFQVLTAEDGQNAIKMIEKENPDLIILDILLPKIDGIEVCLSLRKKTDVPILFLSCKSEELDIVLGLSVGGDDYITKPFIPNELVARVKAHLRRNRMLTKKKYASHSVKHADLEINLITHEVKKNSEVIFLSAREFGLLSILMLNANQVFSIEQLFELVWKEQSLDGDARTVMVHISNLRKKIKDDPTNPKYIHTVKGYGYKFCVESTKNFV